MQEEPTIMSEYTQSCYEKLVDLLQACKTSFNKLSCSIKTAYLSCSIIVCLLSFLHTAFAVGAIVFGAMAYNDPMYTMGKINIVSEKLLPMVNITKTNVQQLSIGSLVFSCLAVLTSVIAFCAVIFKLRILVFILLVITGVIFVSNFVFFTYFKLIMRFSTQEIVNILEKDVDNQFVALNSLTEQSKYMKDFTEMLSYIQAKESCCGVVEHMDVVNSSSWLSSDRKVGSKELTIPIACCQVQEEKKAEFLKTVFQDFQKAENLLVNADCPYSTPVNATTAGVYDIKCSGKIEAIAQQSLIAYFIIGIVHSSVQVSVALVALFYNVFLQIISEEEDADDIKTESALL